MPEIQGAVGTGGYFWEHLYPFIKELDFWYPCRERPSDGQLVPKGDAFND